MLKKIKEFLFGKPAVPVAGQATKGNDASWAEAKEVADVLKAVAVQKEAEAVAQPVAEPVAELTPQPKPTKKKRTFVKREDKAEPKTAPQATWPFPVEKPSEGVTPAELEALTAPAAMKVQRKRKAKADKPE
jgi:hypothetical protein